MLDAAILRFRRNLSGGYDLELTSPFAASDIIRDVADPKLIFGSFRNSVATHLSALPNRTDPSAVFDAVKELYRSGNQALEDLLQVNTPADRSKTRRMRAFFSAVVSSPFQEVRVVNVIAPHPLPLDCLPVLGPFPSTLQRAGAINSLDQVCSLA